MDTASFEYLLELVSPFISKQNTRMLEAIPPGERLALTLRYLATELVSAIKKSVSIPVFVIIRLRPGSFHYTAPEVEKMLEEILIMKNLGVNGLVFGALDKDGNVDISVCQQVLAASAGIPVTFHRAFDEVVSKSKALEEIIELGFQRILTTGGPETAVEGIHELKSLNLQANSRIIIMPGGGVTDSNILMILEATKATEFHSSGRISDPDSPTSKSKICSGKVIQNMRNILEHSE